MISFELAMSSDDRAEAEIAGDFACRASSKRGSNASPNWLREEKHLNRRAATTRLNELLRRCRFEPHSPLFQLHLFGLGRPLVRAPAPLETLSECFA